MLRSIKNLRRNAAVLVFPAIFLMLGFAAAPAAAQTGNLKKTDSTSKKAIPTPKKIDKKIAAKATTTAKVSTDKKTVAGKTSKTPVKTTDAKKPVAKTTKSGEKSAKPSAKTVSTSAKTGAKISAKTASVKKSPPRLPETPAKAAPVKTVKISQPKSVVKPAGEPSQAIILVTAARIRREPATNAAEVRRLKLGTLVKVLEENPAWYKVEIPNLSNQAGWISKQIAGDFEESSRDALYRRIAERNFKTGSKMSFTDAAEVYEFLTRAQTEVGSQNLSSEIALKRIEALRAALKAVPAGKSEAKPYDDFLKSNAKSIVYSEPSGEWYVRSELLWDLQKKYARESIGEEIAWTAAQNPLPGECEGYVNCYLFVLRETAGEYLTLYPTGKYAEQSLKNIQNLIEPIAADLKEKSIYNGPTDVSDRAEFNRLVSELRSIVSRLPFSELEKQKTIQQLNKIAEGYR